MLEDPLILVHEKKLNEPKALIPLLEAAITAERPLVIIAEDVDDAILATLVVNALRGSLRVCAVKAPEFGESRREVLEDIAILTGTSVIAPDHGPELSLVTLAQLGTARRVVIDRDATTIVDGAGDPADLAKRVAWLEARIADDPSAIQQGRLKKRLAKLKGGVAIIRVGAATHTELSEKLSRYEDALQATRAAAEEGVVPGGGVALLRALGSLEAVTCRGEQRFGVDVVRRAVQQPLRQMAENAGVDASIVVHEVLKGSGAFGYNVATDRYEDLLAAGIIDPAKVVRVALQSAASVASLMLTSEVAIRETDQ